MSSIHEAVTWLVSNRAELPFFHFNELLCKSYENLMCLELCDGDIQDQVSPTGFYFCLKNKLLPGRQHCSICLCCHVEID